MSFSKERSLRPFFQSGFLKFLPPLLFLLAVLLMWAPGLRAAVEGDPMHWSGDKTFWDRKNNRVELYGHATVNQPGESLTADYISLDLTDHIVDAKGNCVYIASDTIINSNEIHFNLETKTGSIVSGRVSDGRFLLVGERINKLGDRKYQTHKAEYTTCIDCPGSWAFHAEDVELEFEGYAYMTNVTGKVKDVPVVWSPYLVVPVKSQRQTGFLFPKFGESDAHGGGFVLPFFWAISRSTDMTIGLGRYSDRGNRLEWEGRYALNEGSGEVDFYLQEDVTFGELNTRWALQISQDHKLPFDIKEKLKIREVSDNKYPIQFDDDIEGVGEPVLASDLILSRPSPNVSTYVQARRLRNLLFFNDDTSHKLGFDKRTVQLMPKASVATGEKPLFETPVFTGVTLGLSNFTRTAGPFDFDVDKEGKPTGEGDFRPGIDPVREAVRFNVTPSLYTTIRPFDILSFQPSAEYRAFFYDFSENQLTDLQRGYLLAQADLSLQLEKIYETEDKYIPRYKHLIRPRITYSAIPFVNEPSHPFISQTKYKDGYNFDNNDSVPLDTPPSIVNYFIPLGNSISYGATTQLIRRRSEITERIPTYQRIVELTAGQSLNLLQLKKSENERIPFSRLFAEKILSFDKWGWQTEYFYYPKLTRLLPEQPEGDLSPHQVSTSLSYTFENEIKQYVLLFERSVSLRYSFARLTRPTKTGGLRVVYSLSDYLMPAMNLTYDFLGDGKFLSKILELNFQSPSRCWKVTFIFEQTPNNREFKLNFSLNWTGQGYTGVGDAASNFVGGS